MDPRDGEAIVDGYEAFINVTVHPLLFADVRINTPRGIDLANAA